MNNRVGEIAQQFVMEANVAHPPAAQAADLTNATATPKEQSQPSGAGHRLLHRGQTLPPIWIATKLMVSLTPAPPASCKDSAVAASITAGAGEMVEMARAR